MTVSQENPLAWVTGGSRGIGEAICTQLSNDGFRVKALSRSDFDIGQDRSRTKFLTSSTDFPSILILNAGVNNPSSVEEQPMSEFESIFETNFNGNIEILRSVLPEMKKYRFGKIVAISSLYATRAREGRSAYSSSKAALEAYIRSIAVEYAPYGVMANIVAPGFVDTELTRKNNSLEQIENLVSKIPMSRLATPNEIANVVSFLVSSKNSYMTGQTIYVDGGVSVI